MQAVLSVLLPIFGLILAGFAEAARAAHTAHDIAHPGEALHFEHSTTSGVPGAK